MIIPAFRWRALAALFTIFVCAAPVTAESYKLQPGDILQISVWKEPDLERDVLVTPDGTISFPLVGSVDAGKLSIEELSGAIAAKLEKFIPEPVVTVSLKQMLGNRIYVLGKVNKPGEFVVNRNVDVLQALSMAGGLNPFADGDAIQVLRRQNGKQSTMGFSYSAVEKGNLEQNRLLFPGDVILVP
ncbi:MAG: polysaccharide biosynthesis/export family protein [Gammaproteobacteria bacterium]|nr:polysaccharide biosynthesis/export family protein [Gammaproteobacteria bacterium]